MKNGRLRASGVIPDPDTGDQGSTRLIQLATTLQNSVPAIHQSNLMMPSTPKLTVPNLIMKTFRPTISLETAQRAIRDLAPHLEEPSAVEFFAPHNLHISGAILCRAPMRRRTVPSPTALFSQMEIPVGELPEGWLPAYGEWLKLVRRTHEFTVACVRLKRAEDQDLLISDPIVAGLMLYRSSSAISLSVRKALMEIALTAPAGAWLAAEGLHYPEEREAILQAVRCDSRLCWWTSQLPGFGPAAVQHARGQLNFYAGLTIAANGGRNRFRRWLEVAALEGCKNPDAAAASLILQPSATDSDKACWLSSLQAPHANLQAYETVRWARFTWPSDAWMSLKASLRPYATARPQCLFHFFRDCEPCAAASVIGDRSVDPLWATELIDALGIADDFALRFRLGERLGESNDPAASAVLHWLNRRLQILQNGCATGK